METKREIFQFVKREKGITISEKQWENWRTAGVLPQFTRNGKIFEYPDGTARQVVDILDLLKIKRNLNWVLMELWLAGKNINIDKVIERLHTRLQFIYRLSRIINKLERFINMSPSRENSFYNYLYKLSTQVNIRLANYDKAQQHVIEWWLHTGIEIISGNHNVEDAFNDCEISRELGEETPAYYFRELSGLDRNAHEFSGIVSFLAYACNINAILETLNSITQENMEWLRWTINGWRVCFQYPDLLIVRLHLTGSFYIKFLSINLFESDSLSFAFLAMCLLRMK